MTDNSQASEDELQRYHLRSCAKYETLRGIYPNDRRLTGDPCSCGIETIIRTEKLKLLAEVRERVVGNIVCTCGCNFGDGCLCLDKSELRTQQHDLLAKLEAEL